MSGDRGGGGSGSAGWDPVADTAGRSPDAVAVEAPGAVRWTYAELDERVGERARALAAAGAAPGEVVALRARTTPEGVVALHAAVRSGAVLLPLHPKWTEPEIRAAVDALRPALVVEEPGDPPRPPDDIPDDAPGADPGGGTGLVSLPGPRAPDELLAVLWTSGTSGDPRGVALTAGAFGHIARASGERLGLGPDDRWLASLSPAHVGGLALVLRAAATGARLVVAERFDPREAADLVGRGRVTHASLVPTMLRRLLDEWGGARPPEDLRCLLVGGAGTPASLLRRAVGVGFPVALTYGLTEATSQVATAPPELVRRKPGTVGSPLEGVEVRRADDGEILVRGPTLAAGVVGDVASPEPVTHDDGWLHTGDVGRFDDDGDLWIEGRRSERIVTGGVTVDPAEVEEALRSHPGVEAAAVVGVEDEEWGEQVAALVVPREGGVAEPALSGEELHAFLSERLSSPKRPRLLAFADALPLNPNGKVDREAVRERFEPE